MDADSAHRPMSKRGLESTSKLLRLPFSCIGGVYRQE